MNWRNRNESVDTRPPAAERLPDNRPKSDPTPPSPASAFERPRIFRLIVRKIRSDHRLWRSIGLKASAYKPDEAFAYYALDAEPQLRRHVAMLKAAGYHGRIKRVPDSRSEALIRSDQARKSYSISAVQRTALKLSGTARRFPPEPAWRIRALAPKQPSSPDLGRAARLPVHTDARR
jgi:hypothetical protein